MSIINCNLNCVCVDSDCSYKHYITYKDRKIVKQFYDELSNKLKDEPNPETRKKNCTFGQLCDKEKCGFRHRLSFANREKLIVSYRFNKICPTKTSEITSTKISENKQSQKLQSNLYLLLDDDIEQEEIKEKQVIKPEIFNKSWVNVVINQVKSDVKSDIKSEIKSEIKSDVKSDIKSDVKSDIKSEIKSDIKSEIKSDIKSEIKKDIIINWEDVADEDYYMTF